MRIISKAVLAFIIFAFMPVSLMAITSDIQEVTQQDTVQESVVRTKLIQRTNKGELITEQGTYKTQGVEVDDRRSFISRFKADTKANVMLFFADKKLIKATIYK